MYSAKRFVSFTQKKNLALKLFEIGAIKFGDFELKSGLKTPISFDMQIIFAYPEVLNEIAQVLCDLVRQTKLTQVMRICAVPYTAQPFTALMSMYMRKPMLTHRMVPKSNPKGLLTEGKRKNDDGCLIVDVVTRSGWGVLNTMRALNSDKIVVRDAIVIVDCEQGAQENLAKSRVNINALFSISYLLNTLLREKKISKETHKAVSMYVETNRSTYT